MSTGPSKLRVTEILLAKKSRSRIAIERSPRSSSRTSVIKGRDVLTMVRCRQLGLAKSLKAIRAGQKRLAALNRSTHEATRREVASCYALAQFLAGSSVDRRKFREDLFWNGFRGRPTKANAPEMLRHVLIWAPKQQDASVAETSQFVLPGDRTFAGERR